MKVRALPTRHDLPPRWDGRVVTWQGWEYTPSTILLHTQPETCSGCGSFEPQPLNFGVVSPWPGETIVAPVEQRTKSGRVYLKDRHVAAWRLLRLAAFRCPRCHLDVVWDISNEKWWDLDDSDYGDDGSNV